MLINVLDQFLNHKVSQSNVMTRLRIGGILVIISLPNHCWVWWWMNFESQSTFAKVLGKDRVTCLFDSWGGGLCVFVAMWLTVTVAVAVAVTVAVTVTVVYVNVTHVDLYVCVCLVWLVLSAMLLHQETKCILENSSSFTWVYLCPLLVMNTVLCQS